MRFKFDIMHLDGVENKTPDAMSRKYGDEDEIDLKEVDEEIATLLDWDDFSDEELGAAISASYIPRVEDAMINQVGLSAEEQAVTIPELAQEGAKDPQYTAVLEAIKSDKGFPEKEEECPQNIVPFFQVRRSISIITQDELEVLTFTDCRGRTRLVVPKSLRGRVKAILHADH